MKKTVGGVLFDVVYSAASALVCPALTAIYIAERIEQKKWEADIDRQVEMIKDIRNQVKKAPIGFQFNKEAYL